VCKVCAKQPCINVNHVLSTQRMLDYKFICL